ncbi:MAG: MFS transporter [Pseudonocardiaceae bacterium]
MGARTAVAASFLVNGAAFASLLSRAPGIRDTLGLSSAQLGLLLLCLSGGAILGLPLSGRIVHRMRPARAALVASLTVTTGLLPLATGLHVGVVGPAAVGFVLIGLGAGIWDVAMNVEGADVERRLGRSLMPRLHAAFSLGTVAGAGVGAVSAAIGVPLALQVFVIAALVPALMAVAVRFFLPGNDAARDAPGGGEVLAAWREPRTLMIGLLVLGFAFIEGSANDWIAVAMVDGYGTSEAVGAIGFGFFVAAMTTGRLVGSSALDRFGRVWVLRATAVTTAAGLLIVVLGGGSTVVGLAGAALWGLGASLGFPVGISAAADDPVRAAARVSVVSSIGYTAFLAGPPLIGLGAQRAGILQALLIVFGAIALGLLASGASRPIGAAASERTRAGPCTGPQCGPVQG